MAEQRDYHPAVVSYASLNGYTLKLIKIYRKCIISDFSVCKIVALKDTALLKHLVWAMDTFEFAD